MKKATTENNNKKRRLKTMAVLYIAVLALAVSASFAWFITGRQVSVASSSDQDAVKIAVSGGDLQISLEKDGDDDRWSEKITTQNPVAYYMDISGNGEELWYPKTLSADDAPILDDGSVINVAGNSDYYVDLTLYFRTSSAMDVYLSSESYVKDLEIKAITGSDSDYLRKSIYGDFSCDGIVGAARVAFLEETTDADGTASLELKNLWIPNDNIQLAKSGDDYTLTTSGTNTELSTGYSYIQSNGDDLEYHTVTAGEYADGKVTVTSGWKTVGTGEYETIVNGSTAVLADKATEASGDLINLATPLLHFDGGSMETKTLVVRLWFEGCDREADSVLSGGMACYNLAFLGIGKGDTTEDLTASGKGLCFNTENNRLEFFDGTVPQDGLLAYSLNGVSWSNYATPAEGSHPVVCSGTTDKVIYIRTRETGACKPGPVMEITIPALTNTGGGGND